jgi:hypothetical protein
MDSCTKIIKGAKVKNYGEFYSLDRIFDKCFWGDYKYVKEDLLLSSKNAH